MEPLTVDGNLDALGPIGQYVMAAATAAGLEKAIAYRLRLSVDEIVTNTIVHGYEEAGRDGQIRIQATVEPRALTVSVEDTAAPFDPRQAPGPDDMDRPLQERQVGGLGIYLAIQGVDEFRYEQVDGRNRNTFVVKRGA